jgi:hypothetical protein
MRSPRRHISKFQHLRGLSYPRIFGKHVTAAPESHLRQSFAVNFKFCFGEIAQSFDLRLEMTEARHAVLAIAAPGVVLSSRKLVLHVAITNNNAYAFLLGEISSANYS